MKLVCAFVYSLLLAGCATHPARTGDYFGLTQAQLAAKVGFPLRVYTLPARAKGGPGILFWIYYQKMPSGEVEEKMFTFDAVALKVGSVSADIDPSRFLFLERPADFRLIYQYNDAHGL